MQSIQHTPDDDPSDGKKRQRDRGFTRQTWFIALLIGIACLAMVLDPRSPMDDSPHIVRSSATPTTVRFSEATVPPSPELSVRSTSRSSPRPTLEKMLTSRSFHTLQSSALDKLRRRKRGECKGDTDTSGKSDWCRETVFPELYFGGLVEALEEHMANGDLVFPDGK